MRQLQKTGVDQNRDQLGAPKRPRSARKKNVTPLRGVHVRNTTVRCIHMAYRQAPGSDVALFSWYIHVTIQVTTRWKGFKHINQIAIATVTCFVSKFHWSTFHWSVLGFIPPHILYKKVSARPEAHAALKGFASLGGFGVISHDPPHRSIPASLHATTSDRFILFSHTGIIQN